MKLREAILVNNDTAVPRDDGRRRIRIPSEAAYLPTIILIAFSVALTAAADFGVSMIVAPAYILSLKFDVLTFGLAEYIVQGLLFVIFCIIMKKVKLVYFTSFITGLIYGFILDMWRRFVPFLNPEITPPGSQPMAVRIVLLVAGMVLTSLAVALFFKIYIYPQVYDFFVKGLCKIKNIPTQRMKTGFDLCCLGVSMILSFIFFGKLNGVGWGTAIMTVFNGTLIALFERALDRYFIFDPKFKRFAALFELK
ncbi:MAG: hypothetical protein IJT70_02510 [Clostridia bacterium]|nr:hypothetical protein [Clostridia bacterium]